MKFEVQFSSDEDDLDDYLPKNMPLYSTTKKQEDDNEENKDLPDEEVLDDRLKELIVIDNFKIKKNESGNKVFYTEDDLEFELLHVIG